MLHYGTLFPYYPNMSKIYKMPKCWDQINQSFSNFSDQEFFRLGDLSVSQVYLNLTSNQNFRIQNSEFSYHTRETSIKLSLRTFVLWNCYMLVKLECHYTLLPCTHRILNRHLVKHGSWVVASYAYQGYILTGLLHAVNVSIKQPYVVKSLPIIKKTHHISSHQCTTI